MATPAPNVLNFTGERFAPEVTGAIWYEHWHRYCVAQPLAKGLSVLDAACGEGYGSFLLAKTAKDVVGIDIAPDAIAHARSRYVAPNLRYVEGSCTALPMAEASVGLIVSFETIEHLQQQREMLAEFRRVLVPGGVLVISSPNPPVYSEKLQSRNEYHVRELTREELSDLLTPLFPQQKWYGQRVVAHSALWAEETARPGRFESSLIDLTGDDVQGQTEPAPPMYFVVVCGAKNVRLPHLPALSLFDDGKQSLYNDYMRALLREKELFWQELDARKIAEDRLGELIAVTNDLASARQQATALTNRLVPLEDAYDAVKAELDTERQYTAALTWEERNGRAIAEARLNELIQAVNNLASERDRAEALSARGEALEETRRTLESELNDERQKRAAAEWEERNAQNVAEERLRQLIAAVNTEPQRLTVLEWDLRNSETVSEERLKDLIKVTNELAQERDKAASLSEQVSAYQQMYETARGDLAREHEQLIALQWEERDARRVAEERLKEAIATAADLARERDRVKTLTEELNVLEDVCAKAEADVARERQKIAGLEWEERDARKVGEQRLTELIELANTLASERERVAAERQNAVALTLRITALETALAASEAETASVRTHFTTVRVSLEQQLAAMQGELDDCRVQLVAANQRFEEEIARQADVALAHIAGLTADLTAARTHHDVKDTELTRALADLGRKQSELEETMADRDRVAADRDRVAADLDRVAADLDRAAADRDRMTTARERVVLELQRTAAELGRASSELAVARAQVDGTQADLALAEHEVERQDAVLTELRSRLSFRESTMGWLRWPLARIKSALRAAG